MTTLTAEPSTGSIETPRVTNRGVIRAEAIKLRSVRSNVITLLAAGAVMVFFGVLFSVLAGGTGPAGGGPGPARDAVDSLATAFAGLNLAQLVLGVFGALFVTSEYSTGLIRTMFAAVPRRFTVLRAKTTVIGLAAWIVMTVAAFVTFFVAQAVYAGDLATYSLTDSGVLRVVLGVGVYGAGVALMGVALGFLLRSTALSVATLVGGLMIAPGLAGLLPDSISDPLTKIMPSNAGSAFTSLTSTSSHLSPLAGLLVFAAWVIGLLALAGWALRHRDA